jgi:superoxide dismutase, Cu-Zn family
MSRLTSFIRSFFLLLAPLMLMAVDAHADLRAKANISGGSNGITGTAFLSEDSDGNVRISVFVRGNPSVLTPGRHGFHIHEVASCLEPGFTSAGGHYDPGPNGNSNATTNHPFHMGDLENLVVDRYGEGRLHDVTTRVSLRRPNDVTVFDFNGSAFILHASEDARNCQPDPATGLCTGQSGGVRLACGVIVPID